MCYSPQASFTSGIVLTGMGALTLKKFHTKPETFLALHPLFFAFQQFSEGFIWLDLKGQYIWTLPAKYGYLFFAFLIWPVWVGLSLAPLEKNPARKKLMRSCSVVGVAVALGVLLFAVMGGGIPVQHETGHLGYVIPFPHPWFQHVGKWLYIGCILGPFVFSTSKPLWFLGGMTAIGLLYANFYPLENFISIWCFWAAATSVTIYFVLSLLRRKALIS